MAFVGVSRLSVRTFTAPTRSLFFAVASKRSALFPAFASNSLVSHKISIQDPMYTSKRSYARLSRGRTKVDVDEPVGTRTEFPLTEKKEEDRYKEYEKGGAGGEEGSQETAITPDVRRHLTKVYGTLMAGAGFAAGGAIVGAMAPAVAVAGLIGSLVGVIALAFMDRSRVTLRQNIFLGVTGLMGASIGPLLAATAPGVVFAAALGSMAIFGGFTLAALRAKRKSMLMLGGPLMGGMFFILAASLSSIFLPLLGVTSPAILGALYNINLYGGLALFSLFIAYDTQAMIENYHAGDDDHVSPALNMFLNVFNIFIRLIQIFRGDN